ncbi:MAG: zinc ABC transporter ATP-binding protein AztA [Acidimicrobiia bacterium]|jgi:manganese transport system ATP-binding protein
MTPIVSADGVSVAFGATRALAPSDFRLPRGAVISIIGPNGSGKSTLLNLIAGLVEPATGSIAVEVARQRISYVMQSTKLNEALPVTVREVVTMGRYASIGPYGRLMPRDRQAVTEALDRMDIADLEARHIHDLSGGQRQRVLVAQGLAQDHDLLLLDEPMTGIDLTTAQAIDDVVHAETEEGCTVVVTTHDLSEARLSDHVLLLAGVVVASGLPDEVLTNENLLAAYGPSLLHAEKGRLFIDDPAHRPVPGRHTHLERTIHTETDRGGTHGE